MRETRDQEYNETADREEVDSFKVMFRNSPILQVGDSDLILETDWSTSMSRTDPRNSPAKLGYPKPPTRGFVTQNTPYYIVVFCCSSLVLYGTRAPIVGPLRAWKPTTPPMAMGVFCVGGFGWPSRFFMA